MQILAPDLRNGSRHDAFGPTLRNGCLVKPQGNNTTITGYGFNNSAAGTSTGRNVATTGLLASCRRLAYVSASTAGNAAGWRHVAQQFWRGNGAGLGGFAFGIRFALTQLQTGSRWAVGMFNTGSILANGEPSALLSFVGIGQDSTDSTIQFMHNDASGSATKSTTGLSTPTATQLLEARVWCPPNAASVNLSIEVLNTGSRVEYVAAADLPASNILLAPQLWLNNNTVDGQVVAELVTAWIETDY
jgi:hypothetical protein